MQFHCAVDTSKTTSSENCAGVVTGLTIPLIIFACCALVFCVLFLLFFFGGRRNKSKKSDDYVVDNSQEIHNVELTDMKPTSPS